MSPAPRAVSAGSHVSLDLRRSAVTTDKLRPDGYQPMVSASPTSVRVAELCALGRTYGSLPVPICGLTCGYMQDSEFWFWLREPGRDG
jgi:hypothetical protein